MTRAEAAALLALLLLVLALTITPITNNDVFIHVRTGESILRSLRVPRVDDYSALARGRPYVAHEWLAAVLFRLVQEAAGWNGLILLQALVAVAVASLLYVTSRRDGVSPGTALPALAFVMILAASRFMERPHIFTSLLIAAYLCLLSRRRRSGRPPLWVFLLLQILWANLHGGFLLGPLLLALAAAGDRLDPILERRAASGRGVTVTAAGRGAAPSGTTAPPRREAGAKALLAAGCVLVSLVNPYGVRLLRFPFTLTGSSFMGEIYEWLPPLVAIDLRSASVTLSPYASTYMALYYLAWIGFAVVTLSRLAARLRRGQAPPAGTGFAVLLFAAFLLLSLRMNRNVPDFALATFPGVMLAVTAAARRPSPARTAAPPAAPPVGGRRDGLPWIAAGLLLLAAWFAIDGYRYSPALRRRSGLGIGRNIPVAAADYLAEINMRGNVFNTYAAGSYLIYRLYPGVRVAMDSRNDVYGEDLYREYSRALGDADALEALLGRLDAGAVLLEWPNPGMMTAAAAVHRLKDWTPVYFDDVAVIYLRTDGPWEKTVARDGYALLDPALYRGGAIRRENAARALAEADRALQRSPSYIARVIRVDALYGLGRDAEANEAERAIVREDPPLFHIHTHLGWIRLARGDRGEAAAHFRRALRYQPDSQVARQGLALAEGGATP